MIGIGITGYNQYIENEQEQKEFNMWVSKLLIQTGFEGVYVGILVALALLLFSSAYTSNHDEEIEMLENRIEMLEEEFKK